MTIPLFRENTESAESQSTPPPSCPSPDNNNSLLKAALNFKKQFIAGSLSSSLNPPIAAAEVAEARFDSTSAASCCGLDSSDKDVVNHHQDSGSAGGRNGFKGNYLFQKSVLLNALEKTPEREGGVVCNRAPDRPRPSCRKAATLQATDQSSSHDGSRPVYRKIIFYGPSSASVHNKRKSSCKHDQVHTLEFAKQSLLTDAKILNNHFKFCKPDLTGFDEFEFFPSPPSHPAPATTPHPPAPTHPKRIPTLNRRQAPPAPIHTKFYHFHEHKRAISESLDMVGAGLAAPFKRIQTMSPRSSVRID